MTNYVTEESSKRLELLLDAKQEIAHLRAENAVLVEALEKIAREGNTDKMMFPIARKEELPSYRYARKCSIEALRKTGHWE